MGSELGAAGGRRGGAGREVLAPCVSEHRARSQRQTLPCHQPQGAVEEGRREAASAGCSWGVSCDPHAHPSTSCQPMPSPEIQVGQGSFAVLSGEATTGVLGDSALPHPRSKSRPWRCAPASGCSETGPQPGLSGSLPAGQRPGAAWTPGFGWSFLRALPSNLQVTASHWDGELKTGEGGRGAEERGKTCWTLTSP